MVKIPQVVIILGSESDLEILKSSDALSILEAHEIPYEVSVISAHRNPEELRKYCEEFQGEIIIAMAGMNAALPGQIKALRPDLIVIGVSLVAKDGFLTGLDALLSIVRMPPGRPVICCGIGETGIQNAVYLAIEILSKIGQGFKFTLPVKPAKIGIIKKGGE